MPLLHTLVQDLVSELLQARTAWRSHDKVLASMAERRIKLQPKKCEMFARKTVRVVHHINAAGTSVNPQIGQMLLNMLVPVTAGDLQQFLAALNWIRGRIGVDNPETEFALVRDSVNL